MSAFHRVWRVLQHPYWTSLHDDERIHSTGSRQDVPTFKLGDLRSVFLGVQDDFPILRMDGREYVPAYMARSERARAVAAEARVAELERQVQS